MPTETRQDRGLKLSPLSYGVTRAISGALMALLYRIEIDFRDQIPTEGAFILAPIHRSYLDPTLCARVTKRPMYFMAKRSLFDNKWLGAYFLSIGGVPINRGAADMRAYRQCVTILKTGEPLVVFPEGTRSQDAASVGMVNDGAPTLAKRMNAPVFPLAIRGSAAAFKGKAWFLRRRRITMILGERIDPAVITPDALREKLQSLLDDASH